MQCDKEGFDNQTDAKSRAQGINNAKNTALKPYLCPDCGKWHLTTRKQKNSKAWTKIKHVDIPSKQAPFMKKVEQTGEPRVATYTLGELLKGKI